MCIHTSIYYFAPRLFEVRHLVVFLVEASLCMHALGSKQFLFEPYCLQPNNEKNSYVWHRITCTSHDCCKFMEESGVLTK